jgi:hypothetical protein
VIVLQLTKVERIAPLVTEIIASNVEVFSPLVPRYEVTE